MSAFNKAWFAHYKARGLFHRSVDEVQVEYQRFREDWGVAHKIKFLFNFKMKLLNTFM